MIKNLTPEHMRCEIATSCPSLHRLEDGRLLVVGIYAIREARDAGVHHELWENAVLIEPALLDVYVAEKVREAVQRQRSGYVSADDSFERGYDAALDAILKALPPVSEG